MRTYKAKVVMLSAALAISVLLGIFLLDPPRPDSAVPGIPWKAIGMLAAGGGAAMWIRRRSLRVGHKTEGRLKCLERIRLQPGRVLHLIEADGARLLVSSGENGVQLVARLREEGKEPAP